MSMPKIWVTVFCGSKLGKRPIFGESAKRLGQLMAAYDYGLVYGGGHVGTMGVIADAVLAGGGQVSGVITQDLVDKEVAHNRLTHLLVEGDMAKRKNELIDQGDVSVTLPGSFGTLDELFEVVTLHQLHHHQKRCVLVNLDGYYTDLLKALARMVEEEFLAPHHLEILEVVETIDEVLPILHEVVRAKREPATIIEGKGVA